MTVYNPSSRKTWLQGALMWQFPLSVTCVDVGQDLDSAWGLHQHAATFTSGRDTHLSSHRHSCQVGTEYNKQLTAQRFWKAAGECL